jgi:hypothetical protein
MRTGDLSQLQLVAALAEQVYHPNALCAELIHDMFGQAIRNRQYCPSRSNFR